LITNLSEPRKQYEGEIKLMDLETCDLLKGVFEDSQIKRMQKDHDPADFMQYKP
jgi:hypothetical protein